MSHVAESRPTGGAAGPRVSVVVPSHGAADTLPDLLDGLHAQTLQAADFEVLVVDSGADGTWRVLEEAQPRWGGRLRAIRGPIGGGPAARRNAGARVARGSILAFTDSDCVPEPEWLEWGSRAVAAGFQVVQGRVVHPAPARPGRYSHHIVVEQDVGLHEACNMLYERNLFDSLGGFSTRYWSRVGTPFGEDAELGWRARRRGARYRFERRAVVQHIVRPRSVPGHLRDQWRGRAFPLLVRDVPELRRTLFYRRVFLSRRSAKFWAAGLGLMVARRHGAAGAALAGPYALELLRELPPARAGAGALVRGAAGAVLSDATLAAALAVGSVRARRLVF